MGLSQFVVTAPITVLYPQLVKLVHDGVIAVRERLQYRAHQEIAAPLYYRRILVDPLEVKGYRLDRVGMDSYKIILSEAEIHLKNPGLPWFRYR